MMEVRILSWGARLPGYHFCSFLIDGKFLLDAPAVTSVLRFSEQCRISNILITQIQFGRIKDIPFLAANLAGDFLYQPLSIISIPRVIEGIKAYPFNDVLWPNFTALPTVRSPIPKFPSIQPGGNIPEQGLTIRAIPVNHMVSAMVQREV